MKEQNEPYLVIIDDSEEDADITMRVLRKENLASRVVHFLDGSEALDYFFADDFQYFPKLILLDLDMPKVHGLEVLKRIKQDGQRKLIPVVIMSSADDHATVRSSYELGANGYLRKRTGFENYRDEVKQMGYYWLKTNYTPSFI